MLTSHIHYRMALAQAALFPSVVLNYSVFLGQALVSSHCNDFLIICLYVMNEMEMYYLGQTGVALCQDATLRKDGSMEEQATKQIPLACNNYATFVICVIPKKRESCSILVFPRHYAYDIMCKTTVRVLQMIH